MIICALSLLRSASTGSARMITKQDDHCALCLLQGS